MEIVYETRFSFFGQSGWKSEAAADPERLFDPARLSERLRIFEMVTIPSLAQQTDPGFRHLVLTSTLLPRPWQLRLAQALGDHLGDRARLIARPEGSAGLALRDAVAEAYGRRIVAQVVLDDDDALACDFTELVRAQGSAAHADPDNAKDYVYLSFPRGLTLGFVDGRPGWLERRFVPYTNLGLTLVAAGSTRHNPYMTSHKRIGQRHPSVMITNMRPYYIRSVHGLNDSAAMTQAQGMRAQDMAQALEYFPFLARHFRAAGAAPAA